MNAAEFIRSGIIETYCLGFTSSEENAMVEQMAAAHPEVQQEIEKQRASFNNFLQKRKIQPSPSVKTAVMRNIYAQQAVLKKEWAPLMNEPALFRRFYECAKANGLTAPATFYDNLFVQDLPSTKEIINFAVWAKKGHEEEVHNDYNEFIAILEGSCNMYMEGTIKAFTKGGIIAIQPGIPHYTVITSAQPMFALVQRQLIS